MLKDTKTLSAFVGVVALLISIIFLSISKSKIVLRVSDDHTRKLDWGKVFITSIIIGLLSSIIVFLVSTSSQPDIIEPHEFKMMFSNNY